MEIRIEFCKNIEYKRQELVYYFQPVLSSKRGKTIYEFTVYFVTRQCEVKLKKSLIESEINLRETII